MELLKLEHIFLSYHTPGGETPALQDVSFSLEQGNLQPSSDPAAAEKALF